MDPIEVRRRNFIPKDAFPHKTATGAIYDSGDYEGALDLALRAVDYDALRAEQKRRREEGDSTELGIGISTYTEITNPVGEAEFGEVEITEDGGAIVRTGSFSHGQGHETTFAMIASERLGLPIEKIDVVKGDTDAVAQGTGTYGSKSTQIGGAAAQRSLRGRRQAGEGARRGVSRGERRRHRARHRPRRLPRHGLGRAVARLGGARIPRGRRRQARGADGAARVRRRRPRSRSAPTSPSSTSTRRRASSTSSGWSRSTTQARSSTR